MHITYLCPTSRYCQNLTVIPNRLQTFQITHESQKLLEFKYISSTYTSDPDYLIAKFITKAKTQSKAVPFSNVEGNKKYLLNELSDYSCEIMSTEEYNRTQSILHMEELSN